MSSAAEQLSREPSDAELIRRTREGDPDAYGALFARHADAATLLAARLTAGTSVAAEDVVSDAFIGVLSAIRSGHGPEESFRAYLYTAVRNGSAASRARESRTLAVEDPADYEKPTAAPDPAVTAFESEVVQRAFASLPERWQAVLWYTEVEAMKPAAIAPLLGVSPNGVSALLLRAREGLREAYIVAHLGAVGDARPECRWTAERLGGHARGNLSLRDRRKVGAHLRECPECAVMAVEAAEVARGLHLVIAPLVAGGAGAAWLASRRSVESAALASGSPDGGGGQGTQGGGAVASRVTPGRVAAVAVAGAVTATIVAIAVAGVLGNAPGPQEPATTAPEAAPETPVREAPQEEPEELEEPPLVDDAPESAPVEPGTAPRAPVRPPAQEPGEPGEPGGPGWPAPLPVTMAQTLIVGQVTVVDRDNPVLALSGTVQSASVTWVTDEAIAASVISFDMPTGHYTLFAASTEQQTLPGGAIRYVSTADATAMAAAFTNATWTADESVGSLDWRLEVVEPGSETGGVRLTGPLALTAGQLVAVTLDAPGSGTASITTLDGTVVTSSVVDGVLLMKAPNDTIVQQVTVVFAP